MKWKKPPLVEIVWRDPQTRNGDHTREEALRIPFAYRLTVGFLLDNDGDMRIAHTYDPPVDDNHGEENFCDITVIKGALIEAVRYIERGPRRSGGGGDGAGDAPKNAPKAERRPAAVRQPVREDEP